MKELLRQMPPVHELQKDARFIKIQEDIGVDFSILTQHLKRILSEFRQKFIDGNWNGPLPEQ